jgi:group I intron endonuclease
MFYTVYKITNKINHKFYIGMHQTKKLDDKYMGSGKRLKLAYQKYGIENFEKEILHVFDNEEDMKNKEKELVVLSEMSYNLCDGGKGGFGYLNRSGKSIRSGMKHSEESKKKMGHFGNSFTKGKILSEDHKKKVSEAMKVALKNKPKSEEHKRKISEAIKRKHEQRKQAELV